MLGRRYRVGVAQAASVLFDRDRSTEKAAGADSRGRGQGSAAGSPARGVHSGLPARAELRDGGRQPRASKAGLSGNSTGKTRVDIPGPETEALGTAAREAGVFAAVGVIERDLGHSPGTLYCTLLYFGPDGRLLGKHRKLKPTGSERLIWGEGDGSTLTVLATELGRIGGLICWENYMPLARMALYGKGVEIYLAPTADARDTWQATLRHIACEGRCFVLARQPVRHQGHVSGGPALRRGARGPAVDHVPRRQRHRRPARRSAGGPGPRSRGILVAEIDLAELVQARLDFDVVGHYARPDVFRLIVDESPRPAVRIETTER